MKLTLNHGVYSTRTAMVVNAVATLLKDWWPHLAILDMVLDGAQIMALLRATRVGFIATVPGRGYRFVPAFSEIEVVDEAS